MQNTWHLSSFGRVVLVSIEVEGEAGRPRGRQWTCAIQSVQSKWSRHVSETWRCRAIGRVVTACRVDEKEVDIVGEV